MAMTAKEKRMEDMKKRLAESSPSKFTKATKEALKNTKEKSDKTKKYNSIEKKYIEKYGQSTSKGKVPTTTNSNATVITKKNTSLSPGALGGKIASTVKKDKKVVADKKPNVTKQVVADKKSNVIKKVVADKKSKTSASASNTKNFASTMAMQKKLIKMYGAKIKADGIMGPKTRAAMAKYMKAPVPKSRPNKTMVDSFKKSNVSANKNKKAGTDSAPQDNTKPKKPKSIDSKLNSAGKYKGTNITPTKSQLEDLKRRRARASST
jgi:hypothetical protein